MDDYKADDKLIPIPFELYCTDVGYTSHIATKVIGIKVMLNMATSLMSYSSA